MKYLFLDTNIYLHYKDVEEIDWKSLITAGEDFTIVIPPIVIREIDEKKDRERGKIQVRAKKISSRFGDIFLNGKNLKLKYSNCEDPSPDLFDGKKFNNLVNDDWLILSAISFCPVKSDIIFVSADNNVLIKAKNNGFLYFRMQDEFLLKEEPSEEEKENQKLRKELETYKNKKSNPEIVFEDGSKILKFKRPTLKVLEAEIGKYVEKEKSKYPYDTTYETEDYLGGAMLNSLHSVFGQLSAEEVKKYNDELDDYFREYKEYVSFIVQNEIYSEQLKELKFVLSNSSGNAQTGDMNIFIDIPKNVRLYNKKSKVKRIKDVPIAPEKNGLDRKALKALKNITPIGSFLQGPDYEFCWDLSKTLTNNECKFTESKLNYKLQKNLRIENSIFLDVLSCENFSIDWCIVDSSLLEPVCGKLNVIIEE